MPEELPIRLNKYLAQQLGLSRRQADSKIENGDVSVNGHKARLGQVIKTEDSVVVDDIGLSRKPKRFTYILVNKPVGYVCSRKQQGDTPTIYNLLPRNFHHLKIGGRLDADSCGLLLLTDDGDTIFKLTHPRFSKSKTYTVSLNKPLTKKDFSNVEQGIELEDGISKLSLAKINVPSSVTTKIKPNTYKITMFEGRNRQIRRTFKQLGYAVTFLERQTLGPYSLESLNGRTYLQISL